MKWESGGMRPRGLRTYFNCKIPSTQHDKNPLYSQEKPTKIGLLHAVCALLQQWHGACLQFYLHYHAFGLWTVCERFANHLRARVYEVLSLHQFIHNLPKFLKHFLNDFKISSKFFIPLIFCSKFQRILLKINIFF